MTEISKTSHGLKGLMAPDTVSTEVDIHQRRRHDGQVALLFLPC